MSIEIKKDAERKLKKTEKEETGNSILSRIYEVVSTPPGVKVRQMNHIIQSIMKDFKHSKMCKPYQNMGYMCDLLVKYRKNQSFTYHKY